jgi:hypothetical protein
MRGEFPGSFRCLESEGVKKAVMPEGVEHIVTFPGFAAGTR